MYIGPANKKGFFPLRVSAWLFAAALATMVAPAFGGVGTFPLPLDFSGLIEAARLKGPIDFCGEPVDLQDQDVRERMEREMLLILGDAPQVILWIKRSLQYLAPIQETLRKHHMPDDLKFIAIAESSLRPHAGSPKGAVGFWQFIEPTGKRFGLTVDADKDERRSLLYSTDAAVAYLKKIHSMFNSWTLAAAAYNMGEYGLKREIDYQKTRNYYRLYLPLETQRYIFRILAIKLILSDPGRYGFHLEPGDIYPQHPVERVMIESARETSLITVADAAKTYVKVIKDLNPEIRGYRLAPGRHGLFIPKAGAANFHERFLDLTGKKFQSQAATIYVVKKGDTLTDIARRFHVSVSELAAWNGLESKEAIHTGQRLVIYPDEIP